MKRKRNKNIFDLPEQEFEPQISVFFPPMIWIFMEGGGGEIKSKQASKRDMTLIAPLFRFYGRNLSNFGVGFLENLRYQKYILKSTDI